MTVTWALPPAGTVSADLFRLNNPDVAFMSGPFTVRARRSFCGVVPGLR